MASKSKSTNWVLLSCFVAFLTWQFVVAFYWQRGLPVFGHVDGEFHLVVSANGDKQHFPKVTELVASAPHLDGWKVIALKPPSKSPGGHTIKFRDVELRYEDVSFQRVDLGDGRMCFTLFPRGMSKANREPYIDAVLNMLYHVVGEYNAVTKIDSLVIDPPERIDPSLSVGSLGELRELVESE